MTESFKPFGKSSAEENEIRDPNPQEDRGENPMAEPESGNEPPEGGQAGGNEASLDEKYKRFKANIEAEARAEVDGGFESEMREALESLERERDEYLNHLKRLQAEFDNFRRRTHREREEMRAYLLQDFMGRLLPVVENMDRALHPLNQTPDIDTYRQGVEMVYQQFCNVLRESGLERIETEGQPFDPNLHEAVSQVETANAAPGTVVAEFSPGYRLKDRVLKAPKVQVAAAPPDGGSARTGEADAGGTDAPEGGNE